MKDVSITERILLYIEDNLEKQLSLERIAKEFNYSKFYIARIFKEHTGITLHKYIQGRRLDKAAKKLAETKQPIAEIAFEAGYASQQAFTIGIFLPKQNKIHMDINMKIKYIIPLFELTGGRIAA